MKPLPFPMKAESCHLCQGVVVINMVTIPDPNTDNRDERTHQDTSSKLAHRDIKTDIWVRNTLQNRTITGMASLLMDRIITRNTQHKGRFVGSGGGIYGDGPHISEH